ncbi:VCBS repeat-containing protein [bacterium]|nr:VCBS repeat-containing protein [bacterium]
MQEKVTASRRNWFIKGCAVLVLLFAVGIGWGAMRSWHFLFGREEINLDGSFEDMLASLPLVQRKMFEDSNAEWVTKQWQAYEAGRIGRERIRREILEHVSYIPSIGKSLNRYEKAVPQPQLHRGTDSGWQEIFTDDDIERVFSLIVPMQLDDDPQDELLIRYGNYCNLELNGSREPLEYLDEYHLRDSSVFDMDGDGQPELLAWTDMGDAVYEQTVSKVSLDGRLLQETDIHCNGTLTLHGDFNGDGLDDVYLSSRVAKGVPARRLLLLGGGDELEMPENRQNRILSTVGDLDGNDVDEILGYPRIDDDWGQTLTSFELTRGELEFPDLPARDEGGEPVWAGDLNGDGVDEVLFDYLNLLVDPVDGRRVELELPEGVELIWISQLLLDRVAMLELDSGRVLMAAVHVHGDINAHYIAAWDADGRLLHWESLHEFIDNLWVVQDASGPRIVLEVQQGILISRPDWTP